MHTSDRRGHQSGSTYIPYSGHSLRRIYSCLYQQSLGRIYQRLEDSHLQTKPKTCHYLPVVKAETLHKKLFGSYIIFINYFSIDTTTKYSESQIATYGYIFHVLNLLTANDHIDDFLTQDLVYGCRFVCKHT